MPREECELESLLVPNVTSRFYSTCTELLGTCCLSGLLIDPSVWSGDNRLFGGRDDSFLGGEALRQTYHVKVTWKEVEVGFAFKAAHSAWREPLWRV